MTNEFEDVLSRFRAEDDGLCWWCGAVATTREHKYKHADLRTLAGGDQLMWGSDDKPLRPVRSLRRSDTVRFRKSLCGNCNNARSQPIDLAYDQYAVHIRHNLGMLWDGDDMDMRAIFGRDWRVSQLNLARYFVKAFGCRLVEDGLRPPQQIVDFLDGATSMPNVHLGFVAVRTHYEMWKQLTTDFGLFLGPLGAYLSPDRLQLRKIANISLISFVGVRVEWDREHAITNSSFFPFERPVLNRFASVNEATHPP